MLRCGCDGGLFMQVRGQGWYRTTHRQAYRTWYCIAPRLSNDWLGCAVIVQGDARLDRPLRFPAQSRVRRARNTSAFLLANFVSPYQPPATFLLYANLQEQASDRLPQICMTNCLIRMTCLTFIHFKVMISVVEPGIPENKDSVRRGNPYFGIFSRTTHVLKSFKRV